MGRARVPRTIWSVSAAIVLVAIGAIGAIWAGLAGGNFMYDLELSRSALARVAPTVVDPGTPRLARRVVIAIIDGLREDKSHDLPYLDRLRRLGVDSTAQSHYPSWSRPNYVSILTGVPPQASGVRTNYHFTPVTLDSLMDRAHAAGLTVAEADDSVAMPRLFLRPASTVEPPHGVRIAAGPGQASELDDSDLEAIDIDAIDDPASAETIEALRARDFELVSPFDDARHAPWPGGFTAAGRALVDADHDLIVLLFDAVDMAGHAHGADSDEYDEAREIADRAFARALIDLDLTQDAVIIVADHGHTNRGGHGGLEPEVMTVPLIMAGAGVRVGAVANDAHLADISPTAAALLGIAAPGHGLGRTLTEVLTLSPAAVAARVAADQERFAVNQRVVVGASDRFAQDTLERRALRLGLIGLLAALAIGLAIGLHHAGAMRIDRRALLLGVPAFFVVYYSLIGIIGQRFSPSFLPTARGSIALELAKYGAVGIAAHLGVGWLALRRHRQLADRLAAANGVAWTGLALTMLPAGLLWAFFPTPYVEVPGPRLLVLIPAVQVAVACYALGVALSLVIEVVVFFARAVDPTVRMVRLERAMERTRLLLENGSRPFRRPRRPRVRRARTDPAAAAAVPAVPASKRAVSAAEASVDVSETGERDG